MIKCDELISDQNLVYKMEASRCTASTKKGERCSRKAVVNGLCTQHSRPTTIKRKKERIINKEEGTITITFGNCAENHVGMEKISIDDECENFTCNDLRLLDRYYSESGYATEYIDLANNDKELPVTKSPVNICFPEASILIIREYISNNVAQEIYNELTDIEWDKKYYSAKHGRVVNKEARYNLIFHNKDQESDYENKKGTVVNLDRVPLLNSIKSRLTDEHERNYIAEGNYYYSSECGIRYHGDTERRVVVGLRLGKSMSLCYQWFKDTNPVGDRIDLMLNNGDLYIMSEKAVGCDWLQKKIYTLRHAAGANKYITYKKKKSKKEEK